MSQQERAQGIGLAVAEASERGMAAILVRGCPLEVTPPGKRGLLVTSGLGGDGISQPTLCVKKQM